MIYNNNVNLSNNGTQQHTKNKYKEKEEKGKKTNAGKNTGNKKEL